MRLLHLRVPWEKWMENQKEKTTEVCTGAGYVKPFVVSPPPDEVFCNDCEYHKYKVQPERPVNDRCFHPDICNKRKWVKRNPIRDGYWNEWVESGNCWRLNSYNDCPLFKKEEYPDRSCG